MRAGTARGAELAGELEADRGATSMAQPGLVGQQRPDGQLALAGIGDGGDGRDLRAPTRAGSRSRPVPG
jgi:hypothetical protein